jgi:glutamine cyclotransferase
MKIAHWKLALAGIGLALCTALVPGCGDSGTTLDEFVQQQNNNFNNAPLPSENAPIFGYRVVNTYPHASDAFTEGLVFANGRLFESNGLVGQSNLREVDLTSGQVLREVDNDPTEFAEGLALRAGRLYQLTLDSGLTNVWNQASFQLETTIKTRTPAWGLAYLPEADRFVFSDGTSTLRFLLPNSFQETGTLEVTDNGTPVDALNELEYVNGTILANRFLTNEIVGINPSTGVVIFRADLTGIIDPVANGLDFNDVLNGIAYDPSTDRLFVTGKRWPFLYEIELVAD